MKLTEQFIRDIKPSAIKKIYFDSELPGFGVRTYETGAKSYIIRYKIGYRQYLRTIANCRDISLNSARDLARRRLKVCQEHQ